MGWRKSSSIKKCYVFHEMTVDVGYSIKSITGLPHTNFQNIKIIANIDSYSCVFSSSSIEAYGVGTFPVEGINESSDPSQVFALPPYLTYSFKPNVDLQIGVQLVGDVFYFRIEKNTNIDKSSISISAIITDGD